MARPSPWPPGRLTRSPPSRWNGWNRRSDLTGRDHRPGVADRDDRPGPRSWWCAPRPGRRPCCAAARCPPGSPPGSRPGAGHPAPAPGPAPVSTVMPRRAASRCAGQRAPSRPPRPGRRAPAGSRPRSLLARVSSAPIRCSCCSPRASTSWQADRSDAVLASRVGQRHLQQGPLRGQRGPQLVRGVGHEVPLRLERRLQPPEQVVQGVRELRELVVGGRSRPSRRFRLLAEMSRAVAVITRSGRSSRPATSQPTSTDSTAMTKSRASDHRTTAVHGSVPCARRVQHGIAYRGRARPARPPGRARTV